MWIVGQPAWSVGLGGARPWKWLEVLKMSGRGSRPVGSRDYKVDLQWAGFLQPWTLAKISGQHRARGGSPGVEVEPALFLPQVLLMDTVLLGTVLSLGNFPSSHFRLWGCKQETRCWRDTHCSGGIRRSPLWLSHGAALELQTTESADSFTHPLVVTGSPYASSYASQRWKLRV